MVWGSIAWELHIFLSYLCSVKLYIQVVEQQFLGTLVIIPEVYQNYCKIHNHKIEYQHFMAKQLLADSRETGDIYIL